MPDVASGWGRLTYGQANWGDATTIKEGWGRYTWGTQAYGDAPTATLSGQVATSAVGSPTVEIRPGWGTLDWGENGWGSVEEGIENLTGLGVTSSVGAITPADVVGISGVSATASVGPDFVITDTQVVDLQDLAAGATSSIGSVIIEVEYILSGQSVTSAVGSISPEDVMGLTGVSATVTVGNIAPLGYGDIDITGNTSYSAVNKTNSASYSDVDVSGNTSYTDVTHAA